jgi:hypothetical protein
VPRGLETEMQELACSGVFFHSREVASLRGVMLSL